MLTLLRHDRHTTVSIVTSQDGNDVIHIRDASGRFPPMDVTRRSLLDAIDMARNGSAEELPILAVGTNPLLRAIALHLLGNDGPPPPPHILSLAARWICLAGLP